MRLAIVSLTAASLLVAGAASAQDTLPPAAPPETPASQPAPPAAVAAPPAVTPPAVTTVPAAPAPSMAPMPGMAPPAAPAPAPAEPPAPPPAPTDVNSIAILNVVEKVCRPLVKGGDLASLVKPLGFKKKRDDWVWQYAKGYQILIAYSTANPNVCNLTVDHPVDGITPIIVDLHNWAMAQSWTLYRNDKFVTDMERTTRSWESNSPTEIESLVLVSVRKADGTPLSKGADRATVLYSVRPKS